MLPRIEIQPVKLGAAPNDGTGDPLRTGGDKINANLKAVFDRLNITPDPALFRQKQHKIGPYLYGNATGVVDGIPTIQRQSLTLLTVGNSRGLAQGTSGNNAPGEQMKRVLNALMPEVDVVHYNYAVAGSWQTEVGGQIDQAVAAGVKPDIALVLDPTNDGLASIYHALEGPVVYRDRLNFNIKRLQEELGAVVFNHTAAPPHPVKGLEEGRWDFSPDFFMSFPTVSWVAGDGYQGFFLDVATQTIRSTTVGQFTIFSPGWVVPNQWFRMNDDGSFHYIRAVDPTGTILTVDDSHGGPSITSNRFTTSGARIARIDSRTQIVPARNENDLSRPASVSESTPLAVEFRDVNGNGSPIPVSTRHMSLNQICRDVTLDRGAVLVDWALEMQRRLTSLADYDSWYTDAFHPNAAGYLLLTDIYTRIFNGLLYGNETKDRDTTTVIVQPGPMTPEGAAKAASLALAETFPTTLRGDLLDPVFVAGTPASVVPVSTSNPTWMVDGGAAYLPPKGQYNLALVGTTALVDGEVFEVVAEIENVGTVAASALLYGRQLDASFARIADWSPSAFTRVNFAPGERKTVRARYGRAITADATLTTNLPSTVIHVRPGVLINRAEGSSAFNPDAQMKVRSLTVRLVTVERRTKDAAAQALMGSPTLPFAVGAVPDQFTTARAGDPATIATADFVGTAVNDADLGRALEIPNQGTGTNILTRGVMPVSPDRVYEITAKFKVTQSDGSVEFNVIMQCLKGDYSADFTDWVNTTAVVTNGVVTLTAQVGTGLARSSANPARMNIPATARSFRAGLRVNTPETGMIYRLGEIRIDDITDRVVSANSATSSGLSAEASRLALAAAFPQAINADVLTAGAAAGAPATVASISKSVPSYVTDNGASILPPKGGAVVGVIGTAAMVAGETYELTADIENVGGVAASGRAVFLLMNPQFASQGDISAPVFTLAVGERATIRQRFGRGIAAAPDVTIIPDTASQVRPNVQLNRVANSTTVDPNAQMKVRALYIRNVTSERKATEAAAAAAASANLPRPVPFSQQIISSGLGPVVNNTSLASLANISDLTVTAKAGDVIDIGINIRMGDTANGDISWNAAIVKSGTESGLVVPGVISGWQIPGGNSYGLTGRHLYAVQAADLVNGTLTLRLKAKNSAGSLRSIFTSADYPFIWNVANLGARQA